jgi:hypothetical protein
VKRILNVIKMHGTTIKIKKKNSDCEVFGVRSVMFSEVMIFILSPPPYDHSS